MRIVFFDVDHTLVRGSTAWHCANVLWREGIITPLLMLAVGWGHLRHKLGLLNFEEAYARAVVPFVGMTEARLDATLDEAFEHTVRPALFREAVDRLRAHHQAGERVVLLSASSWYLLQRFRHVLPIDDVIGFRQRMPVYPFSGFAILDDLVLIEHLTGEQNITDADEVTSWTHFFGMLREAASTGPAAIEIIERALRDLQAGE